MNGLTAKSLIVACVVMANSLVTAQADIIGEMNWADELVEWSSEIQNYGVYSAAEKISTTTGWWLTGVPDADQNGNDYAWDTDVDRDTVAGWRSFGMEYFTVGFDQAISDGAGNDLKLVTYGGPKGSASVWASPTNNENDFVKLGSIEGGNAGFFSDVWFDFAGLVDEVHYVKLVREADGPQTGRFFDAIGGVVPEPSTLSLLALAALAVTRRK